ncbi:kelch-like protein 9 [Saccostrea echinata]|uniref:kelch-like protein 9 n=1 Tax=Saccostrea echinata TaxID=191078 RepID=UPI002A831C33|nr:kelch-like protein 9 [Saccostrea echinata]
MRKTTCYSYKELLIERRRQNKVVEERGRRTKNVQNLSETVLNGFEVLWRQNILCDIIIICQGRAFDAHRSLLVTCSDYFYDIFVDQLYDEREMDISHLEIEANIFQNILLCMYTGKLQVSEETIEGTLHAASRLGFYLIQDACEEFLVENTRLKNCLKMIDRAFSFNLDKLTEKALELAAKYFKVISKRSRFKELPVEQMIALLKRDDLNVDSELEVFKRFIEWLEHRKNERIEHAAELMATIRLPLLSPAAIMDSVESIAYLMDIPECQGLVQEALHYHCIPYRQTVLQSPRTVPRNQHVSNLLVVIGGAPRYKCDSVNDDVMAFNLTSNTWKSVATLPEPRHHHASVMFGGFLYVAGGERYNNSMAPVNSVFRYDPRNGDWLKVANMKHNRQSFSLAVLNNMMYAVGGRLDASESLASVECYNPQSNTWREVAPLSTPKRCVALATLHGRLYAVGGSGNKMISSRVESYNPYDGKWDIKQPISTPRFFAHLVPVTGSLLLIGGATVNQDGVISCMDAIERYTPSSDCWTVISHMRTPRAEFGCAVLGLKIYIAGGYNWDKMERLRSIECFDSDSHTWTELDKCLPLELTGLSLACMKTYNGNDS